MCMRSKYSLNADYHHHHHHHSAENFPTLTEPGRRVLWLNQASSPAGGRPGVAPLQAHQAQGTAEELVTFAREQEGLQGGHTHRSEAKSIMFSEELLDPWIEEKRQVLSSLGRSPTQDKNRSGH